MLLKFIPFPVLFSIFLSRFISRRMRKLATSELCILRRKKLNHLHRNQLKFCMECPVFININWQHEVLFKFSIFLIIGTQKRQKNRHFIFFQLRALPPNENASCLFLSYLHTVYLSSNKDQKPQTYRWAIAQYIILNEDDKVRVRSVTVGLATAAYR